MACNDPAWDRVISALGLLLFNALHSEMFMTNDAILCRSCDVSKHFCNFLVKPIQHK